MRWRRNEQGAVAIVLALVVCFVLIPISALAVDLGEQRVARRDMQALADVVALDMSRQLTGGKLSSYSMTSLQALANASRDRNASTIGHASNGKNADVAFELGTTDPTKYGQSDYFTKVTDPNGVPSAVRVTANTTVDFGLANALPGGGIGNGGAERSAVAISQTSACFDLGSYAAALDSNDSTLLAPLNKLLGLNLDLVSYKGLAGASLNLADLAADSHIGSVDELLGGNVTLGNFTAAAIDVLNKQDQPGNAVALSALQAIQASGIDLSKKVDIAKMISLQSTDNAALESNMNVLDLISGAIQVANGQHGVDVSGLNIAGITGGLYVTQGIDRACGTANSLEARATASQINANLGIPVSFPSGSSVLGLTVTGSATVSGGIGNANGQLVSPPAVVCKAGTVASPDTYRVDVNGGLLGFGLQASVNINGSVSTGLLGGLLDLLVGLVSKVTFNNVSITVGTGAPGTSSTAQHADLKVPQNALNTTPRGTPVKTGSAFGGIGTVPSITTSTAITGTITVKGLLGTVNIDLSRGGGVGSLIATLLGTVNGVLTTTVNNAIAPTLNNLLTPLGKLLGLNAGGADVYSEYRPTCNGAKLAG